jgi:hypothetical protein
LSVVEIQGIWREEKTKTVWKVDGIVAQKHKQRSKAVVLSDSPNGVEWGMGNLMGSIEDGLLVWRNRIGKVMYEWERPGPDSIDAQLTQCNTAQEPERHAARRSRGESFTNFTEEPVKAASVEAQEPPAQNSSPRSTASAVSTAPTETTPSLPLAGGGSCAPVMKLDKGKTNQPTKMQTTEEVAKLLEMAGSRLASGDYGTAMQYVMFAQTLYPQGVPQEVPQVS